MTLPMQLFVGFAGRFAFVRSESSGELTVLSVDLTKKATDRNDETDNCHDIFLSIPEKNVKNTSFPLTHRIATVGPFDGAIAVWNLEGVEIDIPGSGGFDWRLEWLKIPLADLNDLSHSKVRKELIESIQPTSRVTSLVRIHSGYGVQFHEPAVKVNNKQGPLKVKSIDFPRYDFVLSGDLKTAVRDPTHLADSVGIKIDCGSDEITLTVKRNNQEAGTITLGPAAIELPLSDVRTRVPENPVIVLGFSNLCRGVSTTPGVDMEFAGFYDLLEARLDPDARPIPRWVERDASLQGKSSQPQAIVPFGDCFLAAKASQ